MVDLQDSDDSSRRNRVHLQSPLDFRKSWSRFRLSNFARQGSQPPLGSSSRQRSPLSRLLHQQDYFGSSQGFRGKQSSSVGVSTMTNTSCLTDKESPNSTPLTGANLPITEAGNGLKQPSATPGGTTEAASIRTTTYATHLELVDSSDTLRLHSSPGSDHSTADAGSFYELAGHHEEEKAVEAGQSELDDGVAMMAAKSAGQAINTQRILAASASSAGNEWDILQGKQDEAVHEHISALGLEGIGTSAASQKGSEISRTPSQSTTGTLESSTAGSLDTAASSLQSNQSSDTALHEKGAGTATIPSASSHVASSPDFYVTACSSCDDLDQQRRSSAALRRYHALLELVETEKSYAEDLSTLVHVFFQNLPAQAFFEESELRLNAVCRNARELLDLHTFLARALSEVVEECNVSAEAAGSDVEKSLRCEEAIIQIAQRLTQTIPRFVAYQYFCSRHAEALLIIREAEKRHGGDDFAAYERMCGNLIRGHFRHSGGRTPSSSRRSSAGTSTPLALNGPAEDQNANSAPPSGTTTPSGSFASLSRQSTGRLLFADYLIKPIQRLCLYPLVLHSLLKHTAEEATLSRQALEAAIGAMRKVADDVDQASKQREKDLMAELIVSKVETQPGISSAFLKSLGNPVLSGTLDLLYHHDILRPLAAPLRFQRLGLVLWRGFVLIVRVRKNQQLSCKYWFPLADAVLTSDEGLTPGIEGPGPWSSAAHSTRSLVPFALRVSYHGHHFELAATTEKERQIWQGRLHLAIEESPSVLETLPCSLFDDSSMLYNSPSESLLTFFANNVKAASSSAAPDFLFRMPSASNRVAVDRNMIFSDVLLSQAGYSTATSNSGGGFGPVNLKPKEISEAMITQQLRQNATPSIGSAVGAAMGLARMAATQMPTAVKRVRRQSMMNLTEITPACDALLGDAGAAAAPSNDVALPSPTTAAPRNSLSAYRLPANASDTGESSGSRWKNAVLRRNSRSKGGRDSPYGSVAPSPMTSTTDLSQTLTAFVPLSASPTEEADGLGFAVPTKPAPPRSKSMTFRDAWQNSIGRRSRSQSNSSELTDVTQRESGLVSPASCGPSLTSSPVLEQSEMQSALRRSDTGEASSRPGRSSFSTDASSYSSIAQLRRILSASSNPINNRAKELSANNNCSTATGSGDSRSPTTGQARHRVERSRTELTVPNIASLRVYDGSERRKSEPDAGLLLGGQNDGKTGSLTLSGKLSLRTLRRKSSLVGPSSPASSIISFANSWGGDRNRLNSVEEHTSETAEHHIGEGDGQAGRPKLLRRPSTADK